MVNEDEAVPMYAIVLLYYAVRHHDNTARVCVAT
jgi:hypothetical protein